jgi:hypothetical protein
MKRQKDINKGEGNMRYKFELSIMIAVVFGLSLAGVASADSVTKTLYVDGVKVGTSAASQAISFPYQRLTIGCEGNAWVRYNGLVGEIDEFAVYNRILTDANVATHYGAGPGGYAAAITADSPVLYLQFEDGSSADGSKAANSVTADTNSTYKGAVTLTGAGGGYTTGGKAAILDGNSCIDVCDWDAKFSTTDVSVEFWVKTTQSSGYPRFFQHNGADTEQRSYGAMYTAGTNSVGLIGGGSTGYVNSTINDGQWHHIVVTFDSIKPRPYATEVMDDDPCVYLKFDNMLPVDSSENHYWTMYSSEAQIRSVLGAIGGKALYLDNSGTGSTARAYVWNNYGGLNYREFPGWTDYWDDAYAIAPGDITFEFWMKSTPELTPATYAILFQQHGSNTREPNAPGMGLSGTSPRALRICGGSQWWYPGVNAPLDGKWHHVVVTYDENDANFVGGDMGIQLYLDGSLVGQTTINDPVNQQALLGPELSHLIIGAANNLGYGWNGFGGYIDEFAVYAGVLSADRVAAHYAAGQPSSAGWPVDCADVWAKRLGLTGDLNRDCFVDFYDYAIFADDWRAQ